MGNLKVKIMIMVICNVVSMPYLYLSEWKSKMADNINLN